MGDSIRGQLAIWDCSSDIKYHPAKVGDEGSIIILPGDLVCVYSVFGFYSNGRDSVGSGSFRGLFSKLIRWVHQGLATIAGTASWFEKQIAYRRDFESLPVDPDVGQPTFGGLTSAKSMSGGLVFGSFSDWGGFDFVASGYTG